jgi:hypothetical protein
MSIKASFPDIKPSLMLDFANTKRLDPRITFTRATTATYYDGQTVAKAEENLMEYSQEFDRNAGWSKSRASIVADDTTAPDGTLTADKFIPNTESNRHHCREFFTAGFLYAISIFAKAGE